MTDSMCVLDLFSGIGAFSLGLQRAGMRTVAFCEIDPFCRRVLAKHWPEVRCYADIKELSAQHLAADGSGAIDLICGGFPCQDISVAGRGAGIAGERSGLWGEFARIVGELGPSYVIVENVAALLQRGLATVLGDLASLGYDAEWHCIPASAVGAPHQRDRVWIIAYAGREGRRENIRGAHGDESENGPQYQLIAGGNDAIGPLANADGGGRREQRDVGEAVAGTCAGQSGDGGARSYANSPRLALRDGSDLARWAHASVAGADWWAVEPDVGRVVDGPAAKVDRRKRLIGLGNSLVPQIAELIGRAILQRAERDDDVG